MIAKAKSITYGANGIDYALSRDKAEVIDKHLVAGNNGNEIKNEFKIFQSLNHRCEKNDISFVVSPEISEGKKLTNQDFKAISDDFMAKMNLKNHQYIVVKHNEKEHVHLHIYANRIDKNGNAYKDNFISKKAQRVADEIAKERKMIRVKDVQMFKKEQTKGVRKEIFRRHKIALDHKPKNLKEYADLMRGNNVKVIPSINNAGKLQGLKMEFQGQIFKASEVNRAMSLNKVTKAIELANKIVQSKQLGL